MKPVSSLKRSKEPKTGPIQDQMNPVHIFMNYRVITKEMTEIKHVLLSHGVT
jgi:hypothetical protein